MLFTIHFEDDPAADPGLRARHMADHLAFLERNAATVQAAGPLVDADDAVRGGLWLADCPGRAAAQTLVETDPFWPTGLRASVTIRRWKQVFAGGRRL